MKVEKATILLRNDAAETTLEYLNIPMKELAHALIELAQPKLDIVIPESQIEKFKADAKRDYMNSTKLFTDFEAYQELYVRLKKAEFIRIEHDKQAYSEVVMASAPMKKKVFQFDYTLKPYRNEQGHLVADMETESIEAWDEEHATLLFEKRHPGKSFDPPY
jgi:hypothetical protein